MLAMTHKLSRNAELAGTSKTRRGPAIIPKRGIEIILSRISGLQSKDSTRHFGHL